MDGEIWLFEGIREGKYHVVYRHLPEPSSFTEMVHLLAKDLAKLDDSWVPKAFGPEPPIKIVTSPGTR
ncbi:MAG TPA: hypothetical protein VLY23_08790 [Candidatus Acidoferrum sp.]|nr:hypothetical protein [Candidatus Acidoferrum sp.]